MLSPSKPGEKLSLYLAVSQTGRYPPMEKLAFTLIMAARKLRPYFQAHTIVVQINKLLRKMMNNPKAVG